MDCKTLALGWLFVFGWRMKDIDDGDDNDYDQGMTLSRTENTVLSMRKDLKARQYLQQISSLDRFENSPKTC